VPACTSIAGTECEGKRLYYLDGHIMFKAPLFHGVVCRELVIAYFAYSATAMVFTAHMAVDMLVNSNVDYGGQPPELSAYEKAAAAFILFMTLLSTTATWGAMKAVEDIRNKRHEEYSR